MRIEVMLQRFVSLGYVLHGSPTKSEILLPQEPQGGGSKKCPIGVYATTAPKLAMFYAAVRQRTPGKGYVYVCPSESFQVRSKIESCSPIPVKPIRQIPVDLSDFAGDKPLFEAINEILSLRHSE
ncbi:MAG: hypothetical protein A4E49_00158 [Methanosaeta sp. PtaU1.Bin112]|nr:MAG: hypothetical protein A4E49_00158 [Methanosaeta sp. PtaU1.Bin112]